MNKNQVLLEFGVSCLFLIYNPKIGILHVRGGRSRI